MSNLSLSNLELKIDDLIRRHIQLQSENHLLRKQLESIQAEKASLFSKHQLAANRIKHVVSQLREEIHERSA